MEHILSKGVSQAEAFRYCEQLTKSHYENFTVGSWLLPRALRTHIFNIYAYCRLVDDMGDEVAPDRLSLLDDWEEDLRRCYGGSPRYLALCALKATIEQYDMPIDPFRKLIEANRMDQTIKRYPVYSDLLYYCDHSANPVGHLVLYLFGYADRERQKLADATCTALQLTNFWQDVSRDMDIGRIYMPLEDMERFGYSESDLHRRVYNERFKQLMTFEVERTRALFYEGLGLVNIVRQDLKVDLELFSRGGMKILDCIEKVTYNVFDRRPTLSKLDKLVTLIPVLLKHKWVDLIGKSDNVD